MRGHIMTSMGPSAIKNNNFVFYRYSNFKRKNIFVGPLPPCPSCLMGRSALPVNKVIGTLLYFGFFHA